MFREARLSMGWALVKESQKEWYPSVVVQRPGTWVLYKMINESSAGSTDHKSLKMHVSTRFSALTAFWGNGIVPPFSVRFFTLHPVRRISRC
jgi:hypothetical protein